MPVIGSSSGSIPDVVGQGGWIVPEGDAPALAALITGLAAAPERVAAVAAVSLREVLRRFGYPVVSADLRRAWVRAAAARRESAT